jgi:hypothetical protein
MYLKYVDDSDFLLTNRREYPLIRKEIIKQVLITGETHLAHVRDNPLGGDYREIYLYGKDSYESIPAFTQPLHVDYGGVNYFVADARALMGVSRTGEYVIRQPTLLDRLTLQTSLMGLWASGETALFKGDAQFAGVIFGEVVSTILMQQWNLGISDALYVKLVAALYYGSMMHTQETFTQAEAAKSIMRWCKVPNTPKTEALRDEIGYLGSFEAFVTQIKLRVESTRVQRDLTPIGLLTPFTRSMFGPYMNETLALSTIMPSVWTAVVASTLDNRSFTKTLVGSAVDRLKRDPRYTEMNQVIQPAKLTVADLNAY